MCLLGGGGGGSWDRSVLFLPCHSNRNQNDCQFVNRIETGFLLMDKWLESAVQIK